LIENIFIARYFNVDFERLKAEHINKL